MVGGGRARGRVGQDEGERREADGGPIARVLTEMAVPVASRSAGTSATAAALSAVTSSATPALPATSPGRNVVR